MRLWNPHRGVPIKTYTGHGYDVRDVAVVSDNSKCVHSPMRCQRSPVLPRQRRQHEHSSGSCWSCRTPGPPARPAPPARRFASCGGDRQIFLWDVSTGNIIRKFRGHEAIVNAVGGRAVSHNNSGQL